MTTTHFISCSLLLGAMGVSAQAESSTSSVPQPAARPNILFIMADDHGRQATSCYNPNSLIQTPNIDRIAKEGIRFTSAFANNSICSPSRAVLLTGKYNHLCGVRKLDERFDGQQQTFPKLLQKAGYQTAIVGKWHLNSEPTGFDYFNVLPGHGRYNNSPLKEIGQPWGEHGNQGGIIREGYLTDVITDISLEWLEKKRQPDKPFCLMIHHKAPHAPHVPAERFKDLFKDTVFPEPPNLLDDYAGRAPEAVSEQLIWSRLLQYKDEYADIRKQYTGDRSVDTRMIYQAYMKGYLRLIAALDENVGRVLDYLDKTGLAKNTIVIYTSDNGFFNGEHGFFNKMWMYEESLHLPLVIRLPEGKKGVASDEMVGMFDMAPTLLDLAGVDIPSDIQGVSLKLLLEGKATSTRDTFYYHYYGTPGTPRAGNWIAFHEIVGIRTKTAKLIFYPTWKDAPFWEYFDLRTDPSEMRNLIHEPSRGPEILDLKAKLLERASYFKDSEIVALLEGMSKGRVAHPVP